MIHCRCVQGKDKGTAGEEGLGTGGFGTGTMYHYLHNSALGEKGSKPTKVPPEAGIDYGY